MTAQTTAADPNRFEIVDDGPTDYVYVRREFRDGSTDGMLIGTDYPVEVVETGPADGTVMFRKMLGDGSTQTMLVSSEWFDANEDRLNDYLN